MNDASLLVASHEASIRMSFGLSLFSELTPPLILLQIILKILEVLNWQILYRGKTGMAKMGHWPKLKCSPMWQILVFHEKVSVILIKKLIITHLDLLLKVRLNLTITDIKPDNEEHNKQSMSYVYLIHFVHCMK